MLISDSNLKKIPILSLHTGQKVADIDKIIINPANLTIEALKLSGKQLVNPTDAFLLTNSIREISKLGIIIDSSDEIVNSIDVIKLKKLLNYNFFIDNLPVFDKKQVRLGRVSSYIILTDFLIIYQIVVQRPFSKSFFDSELVIHRSQIAKITPKKIIIKNEMEKLKSIERELAIKSFVNPFKAPAPQEPTS